MILVQRMIALSSQRQEQVRLMAGRRMFLKRRWRGVASDGTEFGFDLESRLSDGAVIHQSGEIDYIICQEPEEVYEIAFRSADQAALIGWKIGNLHFPVQVMEHCIRAVHDPAIRQLGERENWPMSEVCVIFNPLRVTAHAP